MFDIGFTELLVISVVALIVVGPERLPKVARTAGHLFGRMQRYVSTVKSDISREIQLDEMRRAGQSFKESVESVASDVQQEATVVDDYFRKEAEGIAHEIAPSPAAVVERAAGSSGKPKPADSAQQSLPLDEPDQNPAPTAVVETARGTSSRDAA